MARDLLGCVLVSDLPDGRTSGRVVETEGYLGAYDPASHAAKRPTGRVTAMSGPPGVAYVYRSYGLHAMLNVVTEPAGATGAVLIRALEPMDGVALMRRRRGLEPLRLLCSGPGRLCQALGIGLDDHGTDLVHDHRFSILSGAIPDAIWVGGRIGISSGTEHPWRFFVAGSPYVSAHRRGVPLDP